MKVTICAVAIGGWYPKGLARLIQSLDKHCPGYEIQAHVNTVPIGAPQSVIVDGYDYTAYCAKPSALLEARLRGADIAILVDCAFYAIRHIGPLVDHIARHGYYFCRNGFKVGEWSSDLALQRLGVTRAVANEIEEISSYCVGLNFNHGRSLEVMRSWAAISADGITVPGHHTAPGFDGRNKGPVSTDPKVRGHRHDQTVLSVLAWKARMDQLSNRPLYTAYEGSEDDTTVLVNRGM